MVKVVRSNADPNLFNTALAPPPPPIPPPKQKKKKTPPF